MYQPQLDYLHFCSCSTSNDSDTGEKVTVALCSPTGSSFVVSEGSYLDISDWLNPAKLSLYYQINATSPWVRDLCGQRTTDACEQLCDPDTGESCTVELQMWVVCIEEGSIFFPLN